VPPSPPPQRRVVRVVPGPIAESARVQSVGAAELDRGVRPVLAQDAAHRLLDRSPDVLCISGGRLGRRVERGGALPPGNSRSRSCSHENHPSCYRPMHLAHVVRHSHDQGLCWTPEEPKDPEPSGPTSPSLYQRTARSAQQYAFPISVPRRVHPQEATFPTGVLDDALMRPRLFQTQSHERDPVVMGPGRPTRVIHTPTVAD